MEMLSAEFDEVKGQNRHFDRAWRQLVQRLRKPNEADGRAITRQLYRLATGAQLLRYASVPTAESWCQMMLDPRGDAQIAEKCLSDVLLRATGGIG